MVTSGLITRPTHPIAIFINTIAKNALGWKALSENYLRESGLNYIIVRPGGLSEDRDGKKTKNEPTAVNIGQYDK